MRLEGKIAVIIGAGQSPGEGVGNGRATALRFAQEGAKVLNSAEVKETWGKQGAAPMSMSIEQFDKFLRDDIAKWAGVVKATGMKVE